MAITRRFLLGAAGGALAVRTAGSAVAQVPVSPPRPVPATRRDVTREVIPSLSITPATAARVGRQVWINESGGRDDGVTVWNAAEDFPSLGIGHFIWFKAGGHPMFEESFPKVVAYIRAKGVRPPAWLDRQTVPPCPWTSKAHFEREFRSPRMNELRAYLLATVPQQTEYLLERTEAAIPKMLATLPDARDRAHLLSQLTRLVQSSPDLYPLIDYVNFKGEGISPKETTFDPVTGRNQGWGFKYLLLEMRGTSTGAPALAEFSRAAKFVLDRRIRNNPPSARWRAGWHKRCDTYARPLI